MEDVVPETQRQPQVTEQVRAPGEPAAHHHVAVAVVDRIDPVRTEPGKVECVAERGAATVEAGRGFGRPERAGPQARLGARRAAARPREDLYDTGDRIRPVQH